MKTKTTFSNDSWALLLQKALVAEMSGEEDAALRFFEEACAQERAAVLASLPKFYWAENDVVMTESEDGRGPCPVITLVAGTYDMQRLATMLNQHAEGMLFEPVAQPDPATLFIRDSEYTTRQVPLTQLCGRGIDVDLADLLNSHLC